MDETRLDDNPTSTPPVCDYEGSDYQQSFWDEGGRSYEDAAEAIALKRLLPSGGALMLELGAGAGRNTLRYQNFDRIVLLDYSHTQLEQARDRLGLTDRFIYVAADVYHLPFGDRLFDAATMIRTLHHMAEPEQALREVQRTLAPQSIFILEFANKRNLKSMVRYLLRRQSWSPYTREPIEFADLNFDFHPWAVRDYLHDLHFIIEKQRTVSHFRMGLLKRLVPVNLLSGLDGMLQWTGKFIQVSPSIFTRARLDIEAGTSVGGSFFQCPACLSALDESDSDLICSHCGRVWPYRDGIYDFRM